ncbi:putative ABC transporter, substrate binding protein [Sulfurimonas gotlandica GD1]|uniref:Putative ABC transporter, substrate binding protein n=1 Tax=Sulfurimonas gotlandica (strain DSM 19862 / JCM 16533 / GD1) TaxID=929558 RepID=B6BMJ8_SULGG|nr:ABC transporter substrate-binding protein [Sulfurimonas gotlandica]EDZ61618.1 conserved hypothetical protein [Sulfurimonas gotlandica GD1]EHP30887.1 putative ABC transporter, substrate binding protein [Sulfurimonas gotlandica GD1]
MKLNQFFKYFFSLLSALIVLGGCSPKDESKPLRIGMNTWPGYEPLVLAKDLGYLSEKTLISRLDSATDVVKSFKSDIIDIACLTLDEAIILQDNSEDEIKIIAIIDFSTGGDAVIAKKDIASMKDLRGRKIGVESSALGAFMISRAIDLTPELDRDDLTIVNIGYEHHESEFLNGNIDAVVTFEPVKTKLLQSNAHIIFDSTQIPGEIVDVMIVKTKIIKEKNLEIVKLLEAWYKSVEFLSKKEEKSLKMMAEYEGISYEDFKIAYDGIKIPSLEENKEFFNSKLEDTIKKIDAILLEKYLIRGSVDPKKIYTTQYLKR